MNNPPRSSELPDDWMVALHERLATEANGGRANDPESLLDRRVQDVHDCLLLLEQLRQVNHAAGGAVGQMLSGSANVSSNEVQRIGRFEVLEELGRGGHGIVLLAYDPNLKRQVALKVPRPEVLVSPQMRERFMREASAAARLTHRGIVQVHELGNADPVSFIAAEYCPGKSLAATIRDCGPFKDLQTVGTLMLKLAEAIEYANSNGVVHRDLKPANVMLVPTNGTAVGGELNSIAVEPKITDFGLAKLLDTETGCTRDGVVVGTPAYIPPELARGHVRQLGATVDVYGLGAILYEMLAGRAPFVGPTDVDILRQVIDDEPTRLLDLRSDLPHDLIAICDKCLAKDPVVRYPSAAELACDLRRFLAGDEAVAGREARNARFRRLLVPVLGILVAAGLLAFGGWFAFDRYHESSEAGEAISPPKAAAPIAKGAKAWSIYLSAGQTGGPGRVVQFDYAGSPLGEVLIHEAPAGMAASRGKLYLAVATPFVNGGEILTISDDGRLGRPTLDGRFPAPIGMAVDAVSQDIVVADNDSLEITRLPSATPGKVALLATARLTAGHKHFPSMDVAIARDGHILFSASDPSGLFRFKAETGAELGPALLDGNFAVAADPNSHRWAALHKSDVRVFEENRELFAVPFPPGTIPDHYQLLTYTPDGTLLTVLHSGRGVEIDELNLEQKEFKMLFTWVGEQIKCISVGPRMAWPSADR